MSHYRTARDSVRALRLLRSGSRSPVLGFDLSSAGEWQFIQPVLVGLALARPDARLLVFHRELSDAQLALLCPQELEGRLYFVSFRLLHLEAFRRLDIYITSEQFVPGPPSVYTLTLFHGQPSKGLTFRLPGYDPLTANDALFLYGPLQRQALEEHLADAGATLPAHLELFEVGYSKSDDLLAGRLGRGECRASLGLFEQRPVVLYAPAFNEGASLREAGVEILRTLCSRSDWSILAKLPIDCSRPLSDWASTGGVDWFHEMGRLESEFPNFRLVRTPTVDPALAAADVLVTCISSVGFEFLALQRPVVFLDVPAYFGSALPALFPGRDPQELVARSTINGGREFGDVVSTGDELLSAVARALAHPESYPLQRERLPQALLFNPGRATGVAVGAICRILEAKKRSRRPGDQGFDVLRRLTVLGAPAAWASQRMGAAVRSKVRAVGTAISSRTGLAVTRTGQGFIDADRTVAAARAAGLSVCEWLEAGEADPRKKGRRDHIVERLRLAGALEGLHSVCEVGAGTGRYLEGVLRRSCPETYEVYETDPGWVRYLESEFGHRPSLSLVCHPADGRTLGSTRTNACDLVHAHGVFVYLPLLQSIGYLRECVRVCRPGGHIAFDYLPERVLGWRDVQGWLAGPHRFAVCIPSALLEELAAALGVELVQRFEVPYGPGVAEYLVWKKRPSRWSRSR